MGHDYPIVEGTSRGKIAVAAVLVPLLVAATRLPLRSHHLLSWDSAQFALALDDFDIGRHQPHPPGYLLFILGGRMLRYLVGDANLAFVAFNLILTAAAGVAIFAGVLSERRERATLEAWIATLLFLSSPLVWFYGLVAEIYVSETFAVLLVAWCAWRARRDPRAAVWLPAALTVCGLFKLSAAVLLLPLAVWAVWPSGSRRLALVLGCFGGVALALLALVLLAGPGAYWEGLWLTFSVPARRTSLVGSQGWSALALNVRDVLYGLATGMGPGLLVVVSLVAFAARPSRPSLRSLAFAGLWAGPFLLVFLFIHIGKPGYVLPLVPLMAIAAASVLVERVAPRLRTVAVLAALVGNVAFFLLARPLSAEATGDGVAFASKSWRQRVLAQANLILSSSAAAVRESDRRMESVLALVREGCPAGAIVVTDDPDVNWRRLQYEAPGLHVVGLSASSPRPVLAENRRFQWLTGLDVALGGECRTFWILRPGSSLRATLSEVGASVTDVEGIVATSGPVRVPLTDAFVLSVQVPILGSR
jgi:4-amino-4-deoxy-L-arabinose transferase-like glycosyltransferase